MRIVFIGGKPTEGGVLVVLADHAGTLSEAAADADRRSGGLVRKALEQAGKRRKHGHVVDLSFPIGLGVDRLLVLVAGKEKALTRLELEELGGMLAAKLASVHAKSAAVTPATGLSLGHEADEVAYGLALGAQLKSYRFDKYHRPADEDEQDRLETLTFTVAGADRLGARLEALAGAVARARDLVAEPANVLTPEAFADACRKLGEPSAWRSRSWGQRKLQGLGMRALLAVCPGQRATSPRVVGAALVGRRARRRRWRWSARACASIPAASPSSPRPAWRR